VEHSVCGREPSSKADTDEDYGWDGLYDQDNHSDEVLDPQVHTSDLDEGMGWTSDTEMKHQWSMAKTSWIVPVIGFEALSTLSVPRTDMDSPNHMWPTHAEMAAHREKMEELSYHIAYIEGFVYRTSYSQGDEDTFDDNHGGYGSTGYDSPYDSDGESGALLWDGNADDADRDSGNWFQHNDQTYSSTTDEGERHMFVRRDAKVE
jgi:hypothetical protein